MPERDFHLCSLEPHLEKLIDSVNNKNDHYILKALSEYCELSGVQGCSQTSHSEIASEELSDLL
jgi:hypothetical protein